MTNSTPSPQRRQHTESGTTKLHLAALDAEVAQELRAFVWWLLAHGGRHGMHSYAAVVERAWNHTARHYRHSYHQGQPFPPAQSLPRGRRAESARPSQADHAESSRLTISGIQAAVADEMRGMVWILKHRNDSEDLTSLGDLVADMLRRYLPIAAETYNEGRPFGPKGLVGSPPAGR